MEMSWIKEAGLLLVGDLQSKSFNILQFIAKDWNGSAKPDLYKVTNLKREVPGDKRNKRKASQQKKRLGFRSNKCSSICLEK